MRHIQIAYVFTLLSVFASAVAVTEAVAGSALVQLPELSQVSRVEVILTPERITTIRPLRESDLPTWGCTFQSAANPKIEELINILGRDISDSASQHDYQLRNAVYLELKDGTKIKLLTSDAYHSSGLIAGNFEGGSSSKASNIAAPPSLLRALRIWASNDVERKNFSEFCLK